MIRKKNLQSLVRSSFKSVAQLAAELGWSYSKTYRIVTGRQIPNVWDVWALAQALELNTMEEIREVFLSPRTSTKEDNRKAG